jgi:hypothetical protein
MLRGRHGAVGGQFFTIEDVDDAASYLREKGLIVGSGVNERRGPVLRHRYIYMPCEEGLDTAEGENRQGLRHHQQPERLVRRPRYIIDLLKRIVTVSLDTMKIVDALPALDIIE